MWGRIAGYELRQQLRGRVFLIVFAVSATMVLGAGAIDALRVGYDDLSGAAGVVRVHLVWTLFYLFTAAAFVADAVLRDEQSGMAPLVRASPVAPAAYLFGRFAGGFGAVAICFLSVPAALAIGSAMPWAGAGGSAAAYLFAFFALALPNLFATSAFFFGLATATRSMTGCLLGAAALLTLYGLGEGGGVPGLWEPFGFVAVREGGLVANRVLWVAVGCGFVAFGLAGVRRGRGVRPGSATPAKAGAWKRRAATLDGRLPSPLGPGLRRGGGEVDRDVHPVIAQLLVRFRLELRQVVLSPAFAILLLLGLVNAGATLWPLAREGADTRALLVALVEAFRLVPVVVAVFFAGELFWLERESGMDRIVGATPVSGAVLFLPKLAALVAVLFGLALATGAAAWALGADPGATMAWYALPKWLDWAMLGVLALWLQSLSANKLAGWGYMVFFLIGSLALNRLGWTDPLYRYGGYPGAPLPPGLSGAEGAGAYRIGWGLVALAMIGFACRRAGLRRTG